MGYDSIAKLMEGELELAAILALELLRRAMLAPELLRGAILALEWMCRTMLVLLLQPFVTLVALNVYVSRVALELLRLPRSMRGE
jgi:hypothetical protein